MTEEVQKCSTLRTLDYRSPSLPVWLGFGINHCYSSVSSVRGPSDCMREISRNAAQFAAVIRHDTKKERKPCF